MFSNLERRGGPYAPKTASLGGVPNVKVDVPISAIFVFLFLCSGITNIIIFQRNRKNGHKFFVSIFLIGFSMARFGTYILRIAWATRPHNVRLDIAAQIFQNAGLLLIYLLNVVLSQRILRAKQPRIGWNPILRALYKVLYASIALILVAVIVATVLSSYTLNRHTLLVCRDILLTAITYLLVFTCIPLFHLLAILLLPRSKDEETFGTGSMKTKIIIVSVSSLLAVLIAGYKTGANWSPVHLLPNSPWYDSKAAFYVFGPMIEILILAVLTIPRIDKRFYIPNGSTAPGDYTRLGRAEGNMNNDVEIGEKTENVETGEKAENVEAGGDSRKSYISDI